MNPSHPFHAPRPAPTGLKVPEAIVPPGWERIKDGVVPSDSRVLEYSCSHYPERIESYVSAAGDCRLLKQFPKLVFIRPILALRLETGKCYRTRDGRKAGPIAGWMAHPPVSVL